MQQMHALLEITVCSNHLWYHNPSCDLDANPPISRVLRLRLLISCSCASKVLDKFIPWKGVRSSRSGLCDDPGAVLEAFFLSSKLKESTRR